MWITGTVLEVEVNPVCLVISTANGVVRVEVRGPCAKGVDNEWKGAPVACDVVNGTSSLVVFHNEHVVDVSDIAECVTETEELPSLSVLRRFSPRTSSEAALKGSLINACFDVMVNSPSESVEAILHRVVQTRALSLASTPTYQRLLQDVRGALPTLLATLQSWNDYEITVEPQLVSGLVGLQGRFDILLTHRVSGKRTLVELKSGSAPTRPRANHVAQLSCYTLLHELQYGYPPEECIIWYLSDSRNPMRRIELDTLHAFQQRALSTRNRIVKLNRQFEDRRFDALRSLHGHSLQAAGPAASFEQTFSTVYTQADALSRTVAQAWVSFLSREQAQSRLSTGTHRTVADLWRLNDVDKHVESTVIHSLHVDPQHCDFTRMHIRLSTSNSIDNTALRQGDMILLHKPSKSASHANLNTLQVLKGTLRQIGRHSVEVSLRNKQASIDELLGSVWMLEQDVSDATLRSLTSSVFHFLQAQEVRRRVVLGAERPRFTEAPDLTAPHLTSQQRHVVQTALAAQDWYLIQGPPGTGKTSQVLRELVYQLVGGNPAADGRSSKVGGSLVRPERVLVLAYTNRAVNEICHVLDTVLPRGTVLRHGSALGVEASLTHLSIPHIAEQATPTELEVMVRNARCIVSTIHAMHSQSDIFAFGEFTTTIVDEASQVLDVQVAGILARTQRHILIGDHAQLPPVVLQQQQQLDVRSPLLSTISLTSLGMSIFERLATQCQQRNWEGALAMLGSQGRMHEDVMQFPSATFYHGKLTTISEWQRDPSPLPWADIVDKRSVFVHRPTPADEATLAARLAVEIDERARLAGSEYTIGIIAPFRVQNRRIQQLLPDELRKRVTVDTVERFQGSQRDVIIYSTSVESYQELESIRSEWAGIDRKFNVASTRARHQFILIGNKEILQRSHPYALFIAGASSNSMRL